MASSAKSAVTKIDWTAIATKLKPETVASLQAFRRRHAELAKSLAELKEQPTTVDFAKYRSILKNKAVVDNAERSFRTFQPATYDLSEQLRIIEAQKATA
ncbi:ATP synthase d subunit, partial [Quaeritorhiza haematococci]